ncbi:MAG: TlpA disulfide reductase family protein [Acidobacteriota bacterium]|nr:TlpA disulfide reductase family protein [Acidobacteriota bacterium]
MKATALLLTVHLFAGAALAGEKETLIALLEQRLDTSNFLARLDEAKEKISEQGLVEAKLAFGFRNGDFPFLYSILEDLERITAERPGNFSLMSAEEFYSLTFAVKARMAMDANDEEGFAHNIKQAWWEAPKLNRIYEKWINDMKAAKLKVPLNFPLTDAQGNPKALADIMKGKKALILDFWASWCRPCMVMMDEIEERAKELETKGVTWVGINTDGETAAAARTAKKYGITCPWLVEKKNGAYSNLLKIDSIPRTVLVSPQGKILFNGHPQDPALNRAVDKLVGK